MTMLSLVQRISNELGLASPNSVAGNTSQDIIQILALLNATGYELIQRHEWNALTTEYRFTTSFLTTTGTWTTSAATVTSIPTTAALAASTWMVVGTGIPQDTFIQSVDSATQVTLTQTPTAAGTAASITFAKTKYAFPSDFDRLVSRTQWDKTQHWEMLGPETSQQWQYIKSGFISTGPRVRFRVLGSTFQVWPPLSTSTYIGFEYISKNWAADSGGTGKSAFTADTDTAIFNDTILVLGTKLKYFEAKGFDTTALYRDFNMQLDTAIANDHDAPTLSMAPRLSQVLIGMENVPDSNFGA
jgi:hypothetical protein